MKLFKHSIILEEIFSDAKKEMSIENLLNQIAEGWRNNRFVLVDHLRDGKNRGKIIAGRDEMKEALEMLAHKTGRILNGDPYFHDSWHDIIGYTRLVEKRLTAYPVVAEQERGSRVNFCC